jgi:RING finger/CHY zinc finger protein 1
MKKNIGCPICRKTMLDAASLKMYNECMDALVCENETEEDMATLINIKCNDCGKSNELRYHPLAIKCTDCGSYNTYLG